MRKITISEEEKTESEKLSDNFSLPQSHILWDEPKPGPKPKQTKPNKKQKTCLLHLQVSNCSVVKNHVLFRDKQTTVCRSFAMDKSHSPKSCSGYFPTPHLDAPENSSGSRPLLITLRLELSGLFVAEICPCGYS